MEGIFEYLSKLQFRWVDAIDIIFVAYLIYRVMLLIKGTIAKQLLYWMVLLLVANFITDQLQFNTLQWIIHNFWSISALVMIIIMQPELRQTLAQMDIWRLFRPTTIGVEKIVDEIHKAVTVMSASRTGALIAFERNIGLRTYIETGVPIDSVVRTELIRNIFFPDSPLHDGAIIIQGERIAAAACVFPLTTNPIEEKSIGTRHRAAIGLCEETDAVVVVVSEETGTISVALKGTLYRPVPLKQLKQTLMRFLTYKKEVALATKDSGVTTLDQAVDRVVLSPDKIDSDQRESK